MKDYMRTEPTEKQLRVAQLVAERIQEQAPQGIVEITTRGPLVFVGSSNTYMWFFFEIGSRGRITNTHTKKSIGLNSVFCNYKI
jgi:hypothetical protein